MVILSGIGRGKLIHSSKTSLIIQILWGSTSEILPRPQDIWMHVKRHRFEEGAIWAILHLVLLREVYRVIAHAYFHHVVTVHDVICCLMIGGCLMSSVLVLLTLEIPIAEAQHLVTMLIVKVFSNGILYIIIGLSCFLSLDWVLDWHEGAWLFYSWVALLAYLTIECSSVLYGFLVYLLSCLFYCWIPVTHLSAESDETVGTRFKIY